MPVRIVGLRKADIALLESTIEFLDTQEDYVETGEGDTALSPAFNLSMRLRSLLAKVQRDSRWRAARGKKGGQAAAANMTPEQRAERARKAAMARWAK